MYEKYKWVSYTLTHKKQVEATTVLQRYEKKCVWGWFVYTWEGGDCNMTQIEIKWTLHFFYFAFYRANYKRNYKK